MVPTDKTVSNDVDKIQWLAESIEAFSRWFSEQADAPWKKPLEPFLYEAPIFSRENRPNVGQPNILLASALLWVAMDGGKVLSPPYPKQQELADTLIVIGVPFIEAQNAGILAMAAMDRLAVLCRNVSPPDKATRRTVLKCLIEAFHTLILPKQETGAVAKSLDEPSQNAIAAYRAVVLTGIKQGEIADKLDTNQGQISRWVKQVGKWLKAGNILPDMDGGHPKTITVDPAVLEMGERQDNLTMRQRAKSTD